MENYNIFIEYKNNVNNVIHKTFNDLKRVKLLSFKCSTNFIVFGANSGSVYIFKRDPCEFLKIVPNKEGSSIIIDISKDEKYLAVGNLKGQIVVVENFAEDPCDSQIFSEHVGSTITFLKWHRNELYAGDEAGRVSVVSLVNRALFQFPSMLLMTLDSSINQIDTYKNYLLVSTKTRSYLCNTEKENYTQIGKKLRNGSFGSCFSYSTNSNEWEEILNNNRNLRNSFKNITEEPVIRTNNNNNDNDECTVKIYCARPGLRLWEVNLDGKVLLTFQFQDPLEENQRNLLIIGYTEQSVLHKQKYLRINKTSSDRFNIRKIYTIYNQFVITFTNNRLYIFDISTSTIMFWLSFEKGIKEIDVLDNICYVWTNDLKISVYAVVELEYLILMTLYKKQYHLCAQLCDETSDKLMKLLEKSKKLYLIAALKDNVKCEVLLAKLGPILDKVSEINKQRLTKCFKRLVLATDESKEQVDMKHAKQEDIIEEKKDDNLESILKQYTLNKTHVNVELPEVKQCFQKLTIEEMYDLCIQIINYIFRTLTEDATEWCQYQYMRQISRNTAAIDDMKEESFDFLVDALTRINEPIKFNCCCQYPLPICHKHRPKFYSIALDVINSKKSSENVLKAIPYLSRHLIKSKTSAELDIALLVQYSDKDLFQEYLSDIKYDSWHEIINCFLKINEGRCLNCDTRIDIEGLITWNELGKLLVQSIGAKNAIRLLKKYETFIPKGTLDATFYQMCIFVHNSEYNGTDIDRNVPIQFIDNMDNNSYSEFQQHLQKYFQRKHNTIQNSLYYHYSEISGLCTICGLPLKNDILYNYENDKNCGHRFHKFCLKRNKYKCNICS